MGIGASLAGGCTVGNGMVQTSLFSFQGWVAMAFIALGVYAGAKWWLTPTELAVLADDTYSTDESIRSAEDEVLHDELPAADDAKSTPAAFPSATGVITLPTQHNTRSVRPLGDGRYALDTLGAVCPFPLIEAKQAIAQLNPGERLVIDFDCTQATESIPQWAADNGHGIEGFSRRGAAGWQITVVKDGAQPEVLSGASVSR